jgi:hypothetical protein
MNEGGYMNQKSTVGNVDTKTEQQPLPACPNCGMLKNDWPGEGYTQGGQSYCCQGCAEGTGCTCVQVPTPGFSREGQAKTKAEPRPGKQRSGAPAPSGELSGERDSFKTEEAIDQSGNSTVFSSTSSGSSEGKRM